MSLRSLNSLLSVRYVLIGARNFQRSVFDGIKIGKDARISLSSKIVSKGRNYIAIGSHTLISFNTLIFSFDPVSNENRPVFIGDNCFVGGGSVISPGVVIGNNSIVAAGAIVISSVPPFSIVAGNPAQIIREGIDVGKFGRMPKADANKLLYWR